MSYENKGSLLVSQRAYETIRDRILNGDLPSGTKIVEKRLATELGYSRTPIRESLRQLEYEGLIVNKKVVQPTEKSLRDLFQIRILLEGLSCEVAALYLPEEKMEQLLECVNVGRKGTVEEVMKANERFHNIIVYACGNSQIIDIINRMNSIIYLFRKTVVLHKRPFLIDEHEEIYKAIKSRDGKMAKYHMEKHLQADLDFCLHILSTTSYR